MSSELRNWINLFESSGHGADDGHKRLIHAALDGKFNTNPGHDIVKTLVDSNGVTLWFISTDQPETVDEFGEFEGFIAFDGKDYYHEASHDDHVYVNFEPVRISSEFKDELESVIDDELDGSKPEPAAVRRFIKIIQKIHRDDM